MTSNFFLADNNGAPWAVIGAGFDTATVTAQGLSSRQARRTRGGDFHWPHVGLFVATSGDFHMATDRLSVEETIEIARKTLTRYGRPIIDTEWNV